MWYLDRVACFPFLKLKEENHCCRIISQPLTLPVFGLPTGLCYTITKLIASSLFEPHHSHRNIDIGPSISTALAQYTRRIGKWVRIWTNLQQFSYYSIGCMFRTIQLNKFFVHLYWYVHPQPYYSFLPNCSQVLFLYAVVPCLFGGLVFLIFCVHFIASWCSCDKQHRPGQKCVSTLRCIVLLVSVLSRLVEHGYFVIFQGSKLCKIFNGINLFTGKIVTG